MVNRVSSKAVKVDIEAMSRLERYCDVIGADRRRALSEAINYFMDQVAEDRMRSFSNVSNAGRRE